MATTTNNRRPDVAKRRKDRNGKEEFVVKCSLSGSLSVHEMQDEIDEWVEAVSRLVNIGSLVLNRLLLHCLSTGSALPDLSQRWPFYHAFIIGAGGKLRKPDPLLQHVWNSFFSNFPPVKRCRGDSDALAYACSKYITNFNNTVVFSFDGRLKRHVARWCVEHGLAKKVVGSVCGAIKGWTCGEVPEVAKLFIDEQRSTLGLAPGEAVNEQWLRSHTPAVLYYYYKTLQYLQQFKDARLFTLAPVCRIKRHFITIDSRVLRSMLKNVKHLLREEEEEEEEGREEQSAVDEEQEQLTEEEKKKQLFQSVFHLDHLCSGTFSGLVETDGVSISVHFLRPERRVKRSRRRAVAGAAPVAVAGAISAVVVPRVIAIDPGRTNLLYGAEKTAAGVETFKLSRRHYYSSCGMKAAAEQSKKWEDSIKQEEEIFKQHNIKTTSEECWAGFLSDYSIIYNKLWGEKLKKKWARQRFRVFCLKKKLLNNFFNSMSSRGSVKPVIAFGAAKFSATGRGELSAPTTSLFKACCHHFCVVLVDEYNTSKVCVSFIVCLFTFCVCLTYIILSIRCAITVASCCLFCGGASIRFVDCAGVIPPVVACSWAVI